jgi:L-aspartate oxidase
MAAAKALAGAPTAAYLVPDAFVRPQTAEWETTNIHQVGTVLTATALERPETRGGHYREDFPLPDDAWRLRLVATLDPDGELELARTPVPHLDLG